MSILKSLFGTGSRSKAASSAAGMAIAPETMAFQGASTVRALERIASRGIELGTVIDVGASNGMWSAAAAPLLPPARYLLVEAQKVHLPALESYTAAVPDAEFVLAAAGDEEGEIFFNDDDPFGGVASKDGGQGARTRVPMITLDAEVMRRKLQGPYLLKLDTHGFELPILNGAKDILKNASLVIIETYNFRIAPGSLLFHEMCAHMDRLGFGVIDISEPMWRTYDRAFWQFDVFFVPSSRPEFSYVSYA